MRTTYIQTPYLQTFSLSMRSIAAFPPYIPTPDLSTKDQWLAMTLKEGQATAKAIAVNASRATVMPRATTAKAIMIRAIGQRQAPWLLRTCTAWSRGLRKRRRTSAAIVIPSLIRDSQLTSLPFCAGILGSRGRLIPRKPTLTRHRASTRGLGRKHPTQAPHIVCNLGFGRCLLK